jgi:hypothetical protein
MAQDLAAIARPGPLPLRGRWLSGVHVRAGVLTLIGYALVLATAQVAFVWAIAASGSGQGYLGLCRWDARLYLSVHTNGRHR